MYVVIYIKIDVQEVDYESVTSLYDGIPCILC